MAGDNNLRIIIQASLDVQRSTQSVNEQVKQISQKLSNVNLNVNTDQLKKSITDYEQWWSQALTKEEAQRERVLQSEHKTRTAIEKKQTEEYIQFWQQALSQVERIDKAHYQALAEDKKQDIQQKQKLDEEYTNWWKAELKYQEQLDKAHYQALAEDKKRAASQQKQLDEESTRRLKEQQQMQKMIDGDSNMTIGSKIKEMAISVPLWFAGMTVFMTAIHAFTEGFSGMIEIESKMAGYIQTNEKYFLSFSEGSHQMTLDTQKANDEADKFIQTTHALGAEIDNVLESARLWGRMYKDVAVVQELVRQSTQLSTVDLVGLNEATKMMEATIAQYGVQLRNVNDAQVQGTRILDSWSSVAHNTMAPAKDLGDAFERTGKIASETGVSFDFMNGLISAGVRNTALGGANLGNMWKTVLGTIRTDKAVDELERLGVATKQLVGGTEQWRKAEDILLDLSIAVTDKNYDLTKSYQDISRGVYQFAKLAASLNAGDILLGVSASINSTGATMEYLMVQMDTIDRKSKQVKASLLEVFNKAGDDGLRSTIKRVLDVIDQLLLGLTKIPKGTFEVTSSIIAMVAAYNLLIKPILAWNSAQIALNASIGVNATLNVAATESMIVFNAAAMATARTVALATGGISLLVAGILLYVSSLGKAEKAERDADERAEKRLSIKEQEISKYQREVEFIDKLKTAHEKLTESLKNQSLTEEQKANISGQLAKVEQALSETVGKGGLERIKAAGFTKESVQIEMDAVANKRQNVIADTLAMINADKEETQSRIVEAKKRIEVIKAEMEAQKAKAEDFKKNEFSVPEKLADAYGVGGVFRWAKNLMPHNPSQKYDDLQKELDEKTLAVDEATKKLDVLSEKSSTLAVDSANDALAGVSGKNTNSGSSYDERKKSFDEKMKNFQHLVNIEADGYKDASGQLSKLQEIRKNFSDLNSDDLYGIDENIYRAQEGIANKAKGIPTGSSTISFDQTENYKNNPFQRNSKDLEGQLKASESINTRYKDTSQEYRDELQKQYDIHIKQRDLQKEEAIRIREEDDVLQHSLNTQKMTTAERNKVLKQLEDNKNTLADLGMKWWDYELSAEQANKKITESIDKEKHTQFEHSKKWIEDEKSANEMAGKSKLDVLKAQLESENRVANRKDLTPDDQIEANKNVANTKKSLDDEYFNHYEKLISDRKSLNKLSIEDEINEYKKLGAYYETGTENRIKADQKVHDAQKALMDKTKEEFKEQVKQIQSIEDERHKAVTNNLDTEKRLFDQSIDDQIKEIDRQDQAEQFNESHTAKLSERADIINKLAKLNLSSDVESKEEKAKLQKDLDKLNLDISKEERSRDKQIVKDGLQDRKTAGDREIDDRKRIEDAKHEAIKKNLDDILNDEKSWEVASSAVFEGNAKAIEASFTTLGEKIKGILKEIGTGLADNLTNPLSKTVNDAVSKTTKVSGNISSSDHSNDKSSANIIPEMDWQSKLQRAATDDDFARSEIARAKKVYDDDMSKGDISGANGAHQWADQIRSVNSRVASEPLFSAETGAITPSFSGGKFLLAHEKELILNKVDTSNILKVVDITRNLMSNFKLPDFSSILNKNTTTSSNSNVFQINGNLINVDKMDANTNIENLTDRLISKMESLTGTRIRTT